MSRKTLWLSFDKLYCLRDCKFFKKLHFAKIRSREKSGGRRGSLECYEYECERFRCSLHVFPLHVISTVREKSRGLACLLLLNTAFNQHFLISTGFLANARNDVCSITKAFNSPFLISTRSFADGSG